MKNRKLVCIYCCAVMKAKDRKWKPCESGHPYTPSQQPGPGLAMSKGSVWVGITDTGLCLSVVFVFCNKHLTIVLFCVTFASQKDTLASCFVLGNTPRALSMLGRYSTAQLPPSKSLLLFFSITVSLNSYVSWLGTSWHTCHTRSSMLHWTVSP